MNYKDDITGLPIPLSNKSVQTIRVALNVAYQTGAISAHAYAMTYAETCELGILPQVFGGRPVDQNLMSGWKALKSWLDA